MRVIVLALIGSLVLAAAASAKTYCVAPASGCSDGTQPDLQTALDRVQSDGTPGTVRLGAATYTGAGGFTSSGSTPVEIDGSGTGSTTVTMTGAGPSAVLYFAGPATIRSLRVAIPALSTGNDGIDMALSAPATISDVFVDGTVATSVNNGLMLQGGGSVSASTVRVPAEGNGTAAMTSGPGTTTISDSTLDGYAGLSAIGPGRVVLHRDRVTGRSSSTNNGFAVSAQGCSVVVDDSLIRAVSTGSQHASAISPQALGGKSASVSGTELTILGDSGSWGVWSYAPGSGDSASVNLSDVIIAEPMMHSIVPAQSGGGIASVTTDYSDYNHSTAAPSGGAAFTPGPHDTPAYVDPKFANPGAGDYRLLPSSPLLNFDPTPLNATPFGPGESSTDLAGRPRLTGTGRDVGGFQHQPPSASAAAAPASAQTGVPVTFIASGSDPDPDDPLSYSWHFDDGTGAAGQTVTHAFSTPGRHTATLTVRDATGLTATAQATITITAPAAPPPQPRIGALTLSPRRFAAAGAGASVAARRHHRTKRTGTTVTITVNVAAAGRFTVLAPRFGHRGRHHSCVGQTPKNHRARRCIRWVAIGSFTRSLLTGANRFHFTGRLNGHALAPGRYTLLVAARSGSRTSPPRKASFTIIR